jgi:hypothetical protein
MAMRDDTIANYIQSTKTLESFYQLSPIVSPDRIHFTKVLKTFCLTILHSEIVY